MRVREDSWHVKVNRFWKKDYVPKNLCSHFWSTIASVFVYPATLLGIVSFVLAGLAGIIVVIVMAILHLTPLLILMVIGIAIGGMIGIFGVLFGLLTLVKYFSLKKPKTEKKVKPPKEPGLVSSFLKAKKMKVCPMIEMVSTEEARQF